MSRALATRRKQTNICSKTNHMTSNDYITLVFVCLYFPAAVQRWPLNAGNIISRSYGYATISKILKNKQKIALLKVLTTQHWLFSVNRTLFYGCPSCRVLCDWIKSHSKYLLWTFISRLITWKHDSLDKKTVSIYIFSYQSVLIEFIVIGSCFYDWTILRPRLSITMTLYLPNIKMYLTLRNQY